MIISLSAEIILAHRDSGRYVIEGQLPDLADTILYCSSSRVVAT